MEFFNANTLSQFKSSLITAIKEDENRVLWVGTLIGVSLVALSKILKFHPLLDLSEGYREFTLDIVFELGVALIGAGVTAYLLGILLDKQQENAAGWRAEIRRRLSANEVDSKLSVTEN